MNRREAEAAERRGLTEPPAELRELTHSVIILEIKAVDSLAPVHRAQLMAYLKAGALQLGLLINFNVHLLTDGIRRVVWSL